MMNKLLPQDQVFWYLKNRPTGPLRANIKADVAIIGGGMAGLSAAQSFRERGLSVVLLEKNYCGSGASGKSSGFITPDSELPLYALNKYYGAAGARKLWDFVTGGVALIKKNIETYKIPCDYRVEDSLIVANSARDYTAHIKPEYDERVKLGYMGTLYPEDQLSKILNSPNYFGGVSYPDTFGIQAYWYCQGMRDVLRESGVQIYEETVASAINGHVIKTPEGHVTADYIILCTDRFMPDLNLLTSQVYHAQTFLALSAPLTDKQVAQIFPQKLYMVWDTDLSYCYYRMGPDNRLMLGGASLWYTYGTQESHNNSYMAHKLSSYMAKKFPHVKITFEYIWPGLVGVSKDIMPLAGPDKNQPHIYYISAAAGLPWAAALGRYSCAQIRDKNNEFDTYFSPYRSFTIGAWPQTILGKRISFAISNGIRMLRYL